jgi:hypothetical protein
MLELRNLMRADFLEYWLLLNPLLWKLNQSEEYDEINYESYDNIKMHKQAKNVPMSVMLRMQQK